MTAWCGFSGAALAMLSLGGSVCRPGQTWVETGGPIDPARALPLAAEPQRALLPEQYIWTANDATAIADGARYVQHNQTDKIALHYFRVSFRLRAVPRRATLYLAGPRQARVYLNGQLAAELECHPPSWLVYETFVVDIARYLRPGRNVIAIEAVRGWSHTHHTNNLLTKQLNVGEVLIEKILPAGPAEEARPLEISSAAWRSTLAPAEGWQQPEFDDSNWPRVQSLGGVESSAEFYQWHADAGLINWPGYIGVSSNMRRFFVLPDKATVQGEGAGRIERVESLTKFRTPTPAQETVVHLPDASGGKTTSILLDFGKEVAGRVLFRNGGSQLATVEVSYGESMEELLNEPFLGTQKILVPPHGVGRGVKSAFRYVLLGFPGNGDEVRLQQAALEGIAYPVRYKASFASSDPRLNRIWETAAYTAHLCMQEGIWDGVKRDRGKWMGDMDVTARVIEAVFGDHRLNEQTQHELAGVPPYDEHVNSHASYTPLWVIGVAENYRRTGSLKELQAMREPLKGLLARMDRDVDGAGLFVNPDKRELFVDWAPNFDRDTPDARRAIQFEYLMAFAKGATLLDKVGEQSLAEKYRARSSQMKQVAESRLLDVATGTFGPYWQANAIAVVSGAVSPERGRAIYDHVLSGVGAGTERMQQVTPFHGYYVMEALARLGHTQQALDWMRKYWGGMLDEGATSFWEAYDPRWPREQPHKYLQADRKTGYYISIAHGWASGPALWLLENVAGLHSVDAGGHSFEIRPELSGLSWVKGSMPAGGSVLTVGIKNSGGMTIDVVVPKSCEAKVRIPDGMVGKNVYLNGRRYALYGTAGQGPVTVELPREGRYEISIH